MAVFNKDFVEAATESTYLQHEVYPDKNVEIVAHSIKADSGRCPRA